MLTCAAGALVAGAAVSVQQTVDILLALARLVGAIDNGTCFLTLKAAVCSSLGCLCCQITGTPSWCSALGPGL